MRFQQLLPLERLFLRVELEAVLLEVLPFLAVGHMCHDLERFLLANLDLANRVSGDQVGFRLLGEQLVDALL